MDKSQINVPEISELNIYEGGSLNEIKTSDLINNEIAIKQLLNSHNLKINEVHNAQGQIAELISEKEYLKTAPFISIIALIVNLGGSTVSALAVNFLSASEPPKYAGWLLVTGIILVFVGSLATILYPYARNFFNNKKK
jgi:hypothetical protein